jgi:hypothetical protein
LKTRFALDASTALDWADPQDRARISENLRNAVKILSDRIVNSKNPEERLVLLDELRRVHVRLAACDMDAARQLERRKDDEARRGRAVSFTLEKMADMLEEANWNSGSGMDYHYLVLAKSFAMVLCQDKLDGWFSSGPWGGLGRLAKTVSEIDIDRALKEREAFPELIRMARMIPPDQDVDAEKIASQIFRDGLAIFRRHQGLVEESQNR